MYENNDPRSKMVAKPGAAGAASGFAAAEYVRFGERPAAQATPQGETWYARGQNFIVAYSKAKPGAVFERTSQPDEYMLLLPDHGDGAELEAGAEHVTVPGHVLAILPPGASRVRLLQEGLVIRVFSCRNEDVAALAENAAAYREPHPHIPPYAPWPAPPSGYRIRHYGLDVPPQPGRFGRIFRCTTLMINVLPFEPAPRDITRLSPHFHDDFEQGSLAIEGAFTHHIRWPWTADSRQWRNDDHEHCPAPSLAVIPPPAIHTSAPTDPHRNQLIDIFAPPRQDFSKMAGWVLNADEYPRAEDGQ
jgi:hypothetical protein